MTYSDWREELILTEGAKTRFIIKGLKKIKGIIKKPKRNIFPIGSTKASGRLNVDPDLIAQFPGVNIRKLMYPDYKANRNPGLAKAIKDKIGKLERAKNPKFKGASPYSTDVPPAIPNIRAPIPPKLSKDIKANLSKGTKLTDDQKKKNFADYVKSLTKKVKDKNKVKKNLKTYEGDDKYYPPEIGESAIAIKAGSKLIPVLMTGIGAAGTIMQARKKRERIPISKRNYKSDEKTVEVAKELGLDLTDPRQRRKAQSRAVARGLKKKNKTNKKINTKTDDVVKSRYTTKDKTIRFEPKEGEVKKSQEMIDKLNNPNYFNKIMRNIRKEEAMAAPTNSMGGGAIAGSVEAGDNPPVKKRKRYIYGGAGSRKMWMNNK